MSDVRWDADRLHLLQEPESALPLPACWAGADAGAVGDDVGWDSDRLHLLQETESALPLFSPESQWSWVQHKKKVHLFRALHV